MPKILGIEKGGKRVQKFSLNAMAKCCLLFEEVGGEASRGNSQRSGPRKALVDVCTVLSSDKQDSCSFT